jgi:hypothetical protein
MYEYVREEFNRDIEIEEREKTLIFCASQDYTALLRNLIN